MGDDDRDRMLIDIQQEYSDFLEDTNDRGIYKEKIQDMIKKNGCRLMINLNDLRKKLPLRCQRLLENGFEEVPLVFKALKEVIASIDSNYAKKNEEFYVGFEGSFGSKHVTPRILTSRYLSNCICVEGIVTKCSMIRPKVVRSVHYCPATKKLMERRYADISSFDTQPTVSVYPTKDDDGNILETEYGLSRYRDSQVLTIQEMPEKAPTGQLPRSVEVVLENDLVDLCKPGDRVLISGVFRCLPGKQGGYTTGVFRSVILANQVTLLSKDANLSISVDDVNDCKKFSRMGNPFKTLARSLAPSIHGHDYIKKAVLCLLLGGEEKILHNGTRLRGDINILLIGDPSVAKSQMLRYVSNVAPRVVMTTGRGSSGVGLTAAVTTDGDSGERRLEAGAMVLADRGIVCIDEFDKMSDADRTSIHEVMEQGRVTIAKAGIHARLNARTSVLAAANPVYGRYDEYKSPMENIGLQDSLLSRFDLLFIVLDTAEPENDAKIADHVTRMHRYRAPTEQDGAATPLLQNDQILSTKDLEEEENAKRRAQTYEKYDPLLHGKKAKRDKILSMEFMKKYIHIAKCIKPSLSSEAAVAISEEYARIRSLNMEESHIAKTTPITARCLETMIRLATAHARARMSKVIAKQDAQCAIELVQFAYFKKVLEREKKKRSRRESGDATTDSEAEDENTDPSSQRSEQSSQSSRRSKRLRQEEDIPMEPSDKDVSSEPTLAESTPMDISEPVNISDSRLDVFKSGLLALFTAEREESLTLDKVKEWMTGNNFDFSSGEFDAGINKLVELGHIMIAENFVFLI